MSDVFVNIGDTVHVADPALGSGGVLVAPPSVSDLLAQSRIAHQDFQIAAGHHNGTTTRLPDDPAALLAIQQALAARLAAEAADPSHTDPAWNDDRDAMRGVSSATLLLFYRDYLAPDVPR